MQPRQPRQLITMKAPCLQTWAPLARWRNELAFYCPHAPRPNPFAALIRPWPSLMVAITECNMVMTPLLDPSPKSGPYKFFPKISMVWTWKLGVGFALYHESLTLFGREPGSMVEKEACLLWPTRTPRQLFVALIHPQRYLMGVIMECNIIFTTIFDPYPKIICGINPPMVLSNGSWVVTTPIWDSNLIATWWTHA